jgi:hypothetical protein
MRLESRRWAALVATRICMDELDTSMCPVAINYIGPR